MKKKKKKQIKRPKKKANIVYPNYSEIADD